MTTTTLDTEMVTLFKDLLELEIGNEAVVMLIGLGYKTCRWFRTTTIEEVEDLKKSGGKSGHVLCIQAHRKTIKGFILCMESKKQENDPNSPWKDIASYTIDEFDDFAATVSANAIVPPQLGKKSITDDKALKSWICGRR